MNKASYRVALTTLGCKANQYDTAVLAALCRQQGLTVTPFDGEADAYIVNTCTVTASADTQGRALLRAARRRNPRALVVATGCTAQVDPEQLAQVAGVDWVIDNRDKLAIVERLAQAWHLPAVPRAALHAVTASDRVRPFLKIQDGCDLYCTYCIIPRARGAGRSLAPTDVIAELRAYAMRGVEEVVLTGIHIGTYGRDLSPDLSITALCRLIARTPQLPRVRISSLDPHEVTDDLIALLGDTDRICPHLHLPVQSGNDRILRRMARLYRRADVDRIAHRLAQRVPHVALGTDLIVGFPGETAAEFADTLSIVNDLPFAYAHVFPYSERNGTPAAKLRHERVPSHVLTARARQLRHAAHTQRARFVERQVGRTLEAVVEKARDRSTGKLRALTSNYVSVLLDAPPGWTAPATAQYRPVRIVERIGIEGYAQWM